MYIPLLTSGNSGRNIFRRKGGGGGDSPETLGKADLGSQPPLSIKASLKAILKRRILRRDANRNFKGQSLKGNFRLLGET